MGGCTDVAELRWVVDIDEEKATRIAAEKGCKGSTSIDNGLSQKTSALFDLGARSRQLTHVFAVTPSFVLPTTVLSDPDVDAVIIASTTNTHFEYCLVRPLISYLSLLIVRERNVSYPVYHRAHWIYGFLCPLQAALEANKAVFTEKPISHKPEQLSKVIDVAVAKKLPFLVGYQRRVDRNFRELSRQVGLHLTFQTPATQPHEMSQCDL